MKITKEKRQELVKRRVRAKVSGTAEVPRLAVFVSLSHVQAQLINDQEGKTLAHASDLKVNEKLTKTEKAAKVGAEIAELAKKAGIKKVVFDRGSKIYHGRVKAVAEAAREKGLEF